MKPQRVALAASAVLCAAWIATNVAPPNEINAMPAERSTALLRTQTTMPPLDGAVHWLNSKPLTPAELRGKVVLVQFWTFSCINWLRTLPHVRAWADKYGDHGLVVIGVHTPEFGFEKNLATVARATADLRVTHPVAVDTGGVVWRAFGNNAWPALYFVDAKGMVRHRYFGEGDYQQSEKVIQQLLTEAGATGFEPAPVQVAGRGTQAPADWSHLASPETYVGHARASGFESLAGMFPDRRRAYRAPQRLRLNAWALAGEWVVGPEAARTEGANARVRYRFRARDLHLVMGPQEQAHPVPFRILIDGQPPGPSHGVDVDPSGRGVLVEHKLYQLVRQPSPIEEREFEIEFPHSGAEVFAFTFG
jgi:thiol-disulfide isomerase/thioredoxin